MTNYSVADLKRISEEAVQVTTEAARLVVGGQTARTILEQSASPEALVAFDDLVRAIRRTQTLVISVLSTPYLADKLMIADAWSLIKRYARDRLLDEIVTPHCVAESLVRLFPEVRTATGVFLGSNIVQELIPALVFDDDKLLIGPNGLVTFEKEGMLAGEYFLHYRGVPGAGKSDAFVEQLLQTASRLKPTKLGLAVREDVAFTKDYYESRFTRAYIRGPRGLSMQILQDPRFPADASGTLTEHRRVGDNPLYELFPLERLEVLWSRRDGVKTVQIEELRPADSIRSPSREVIANRYLHSRWDPSKERFVHLDGAYRYYRPETYPARLATDMRKFVGRADAYEKVFRIDAELTIEVWCRLVAAFFEENELALEYLGGTVEQP